MAIALKRYATNWISVMEGNGWFINLFLKPEFRHKEKDDHPADHVHDPIGDRHPGEVNSEFN